MERFALFRGREERVLVMVWKKATASQSLMPISLSAQEYKLPRPVFISPHRRATGSAGGLDLASTRARTGSAVLYVLLVDGWQNSAVSRLFKRESRSTKVRRPERRFLRTHERQT